MRRKTQGLGYRVRQYRATAVLLVMATVLMTAVLLGSVLTPVKAATNTTMNFQARLQTASGGVVADGFYNVQFKLYDVSSAGSSLWTESYLDVDGSAGTTADDFRVRVKNGYLTVNLGSRTAFPTTINWDQQLWLTMNIGGTTVTATPSYDGEMNPRLKLTGVPYAFRAGQLATGNGTLQSTLQILQPTVGNQTFQIQDQAAAGTYNLCIQTSTACGFASASGSANYIQNTTSPQSSNLYVQAATSGSVAGTFRANAAGSGGILNLLNGAGTSVASVDVFGNLSAQQITSNATIEARSYGSNLNALTATQYAASATFPVLVVQGGATPGSGADLLSLQNSSAQVLAGFSNAGQLYLGRASGLNGSMRFLNATNANSITIQSGATAASYSLTLPSAAPGLSQCLQNDGTTVGTLVFAACAAGGGSGVTTVGAIDGQTKSANGAVISGTTIYMQTADASNPGLVSIAAQTFAGAKNFTDTAVGGSTLSATTQNTSGTQTNGFLVEKQGAGTLTNGINVTQTAGTLTNGIQFSGTMTNLINSTNFTVTSGGNITTAGTYNTNSFTSSSLTFGASSAATIQSADTYALTVDSGTTGALNLGTGAFAKTISLGNVTGATALVLNAGTGGISIGANGIANTIQIGNTTGAVAQTVNLGNNATASSTTTVNVGSTIGTSATNIRSGSGAVNINAANNQPTNIGTGTSTGLVSIGGGSGTFALDTTGLDISAGGVITNASTYNGQTISATASLTGTLAVAGDVSLNGNTTIGNATTDRLTFTAQIAGASPLVFQGLTDNAFTTTIAVTDPTANNTLTLPNYSGTAVLSSNAGTTGECLKSNGSATTPSYSACGGASTLQDAYSASTNPEFSLDNTRGGLTIRNNSTPITVNSGNLLEIQNSAGTVTFFGVSTNGAALQYSSGNTAIALLTTGRLRLYEDIASSPRYLDLYYDGTAGEGVIAASSGKTRVGSGTGDIELQITGASNTIAASKTATLSAAYNSSDFSIAQTLTGGANNIGGAVLNVSSASTTSGANTQDILRLNQNANVTAGGNLVAASVNGNEKFRVDNAGMIFADSITVRPDAATYDIMSLQNSAAVEVLSVSSTGSVVSKASTASTAAFQVQNTSSAALFTVDSSTAVNRITIGSATTDTTAIFLVLDSYSTASDPTGTNGAMYYNTGLSKFRCFEASTWKDCLTGSKTSFTIVDGLGVSAAATNLAASTLNCVSDPSLRTIVNLSGTTKMRVMARFGGTVATTTTMRLQYHIGGDPAVATGDAGWTTLDTSAGTHTVGTWFYTAEMNLPAGAQISNVMIRACVFGGNGTADPTITGVRANAY